jgi:hypothetical protein
VGYLPGIDPVDVALLEDNTVFRPSETRIWTRWLQVLGQTDQATLDRATLGNVAYIQLFHQTDAYRGRAVTVRGTVRRAHYIAAPPERLRIKGYWQCWLFTGDVGGSPVVVYSLAMPNGFPQGMDLHEQAQFTGLVYKRWAYQSASGVRLAPLLLAKQGQWTPNAWARTAAWMAHAAAVRWRQD